jgi:hypothetical protein
MSVYIDATGNIVDTSAGGNAPALVGSVYNLLQPSTYSASYGGGSGLTASAQQNFANFLQGAFGTIANTGSGQFAALNSTFNTWAGWQNDFATKMADIFGSIAHKSAKAPTGVLGSIFGF